MTQKSNYVGDTIDMIQEFGILAEQYIKQRFSFNSNFLEANVINIFLLLSGLIYVLKEFLGPMLYTRQSRVLSSIQEAEERLRQANVRLNESEKQLAQAKLIMEQIKREAELTAKKVRESILTQGKLDIERLSAVGKISITIAENQVKQQIQQQIVALAINKVSLQLQDQMTPVVQAKIIDQNILEIGDNV